MWNEQELKRAIKKGETIMVYLEWELNDEDMKKVEEAGTPYVLFSEALRCGYGVYGAKIIERDGKKILCFNRGETCD